MSAKTAIQIENELAQINVRLNELKEMRGAATDATNNLQTGFIGGTASLDALQSAQGKLDILENSVGVLEKQRTELAAKLEVVRAAEFVQASIDKLKTIAEQAGAAFTDHDQLRIEFDGIIRTFAADIIGKSAEFYGKRREFDAVRRQVEAKQPGINIFSELRRLGLAETAIDAAVSEYLHPSPCEFSEPMAIVERIMLGKSQATVSGDRPSFTVPDTDEEKVLTALRGGAPTKGAAAYFQK